MVATGLCFVGVTGIVRYLGTDLPIAQSAFLRYAWGVVFLLPSLLPLLRGGFAPGFVKLSFGRGAMHMIAVLLWFYAMARLPVAEVTAIGFLNPVLVTLGASLLFGETLALRRILAIGVAICGALIVLRPGIREITSGHFAQIAAAFFFAGSYLAAKRLTQLAGPGAIVAMLSIIVTIGLLPLALAVWQPVTALQMGMLALVAAFATLAHYCMSRAFTAAPLAVTQPVVFLQLVWATLLGVFVFGEGLDAYVLLGGAVILAAVSYITWREYVIKRRAHLVPPSIPLI
ncbi:MAG: drug/metabolite transporter (DMT)-like permease [Pseudorhodobacter sp.]|jgi:drug/metabolite transporter (DMT)-like permease